MYDWRCSGIIAVVVPQAAFGLLRLDSLDNVHDDYSQSNRREAVKDSWIIHKIAFPACLAGLWMCWVVSETKSR
jgi:hypothetical protein